MSKLTEALKTIGIFNPTELTADGHPWMAVYHDDRAVRVYIKGVELSGPFWKHGAKWFHYMNHAGKSLAIREALAFIRRMFPDIEMVKAPWRETWVAAEDLAAKGRLK